ncbi:MAG TPA: hypothetical protein VFE47_17030, partial [Tepidisphaeraceae bacterium]|nr:hypothetical protein [Tepidisphaeraceae bacterium]
PGIIVRRAVPALLKPAIVSVVGAAHIEEYLRARRERLACEGFGMNALRKVWRVVQVLMYVVISRCWLILGWFKKR